MNIRALVAAMALVSAAQVPGEMRPEVARLLPPEPVALAGVDVEALRGTPIFERLASGALDSARHGSLLSKLGIDLRGDLDRFYFASAEPSYSIANRASIVIFEGRFDAAGALRGALPEDSDHAGFRVHRMSFDAGATSIPWAFVFLDSRTGVAGPESRVLEAIDRWLAAGEPSAPARAAMAQDGSDFWALALHPKSVIGGLVDRVPGGGGPLRAIADGLKSMALRGNAAAEGIQSEIAFLCQSPDDARSLADAAQAMAAFGALSAKAKRPELADLLSTVEIGHEGSEATLSMLVKNEQLLRLH